MSGCSVAGCKRPIWYKKNGCCKTHYMRWFRTGSMLTAAERLKAQDERVGELEHALRATALGTVDGKPCWCISEEDHRARPRGACVEASAALAGRDGNP